MCEDWWTLNPIISSIEMKKLLNHENRISNKKKKMEKKNHLI